LPHKNHLFRFYINNIYICHIANLKVYDMNNLDWQMEGNTIFKDFEFNNSKAAMNFMNEVAKWLKNINEVLRFIFILKNQLALR
ncbi:MAG: 4a-hydroxytetrahydrobiopterin dehydratase, partial [Bacteroidales bacterium]|nr:4a-hydroxytetrahydrobiopterin dehydratase [Bacteroidales bacterium]